MLAAEHVHATTTVGEVDHLLPRHLTGRHTHTLAFDAVVTPQQQVAGVVETRSQCVLDKAYLQG